MNGRENSAWIGRVHALMREGCGYDDIAVKLRCDPALIRREAVILRAEERLIEMYRKSETPPG